MSELETAIASLKGEVPGADEYARLCTPYLDDPIADKLTRMDPFRVPRYCHAALS
jgi:hypothetical protein